MASVTKSDQGKDAMADDEQSSEDVRAVNGGADEGSEQPPNVVNYRSAEPKPPSRGGGFFTIYKKGQGYWTRMGTALGAAIISVLCAEFIYSQMRNIPYTFDANKNPVYIPPGICIGVASTVLALLLFFAWRMMNKPSNVDFLIATDSEMKKVNWTTRAELVGSTKVVILFMFLIAIFLFGIDLLFGYFFYFINVLHNKPF
jgi:preprotein translocase subunit SecE